MYLFQTLQSWPECIIKHQTTWRYNIKVAFEGKNATIVLKNL